jgi:glyoxylase-like metal-dependent hydrolase (beta-lactamase superfamily II)
MPTVIDYEAGISAIDSGYVRPRFDAIHLIVEDNHAALVDTGTNDSLPRVMDALNAKGISADRVEWVILTHVHLDHAGGAGAMMARFPHARLAVHPRGVRHMVDPTRLMQGTMAVYGEATARRLYGELLPIGRERIHEMAHGAMLRLGGRELTFLDTPGHARHHLCVVDSRSGHIFAGDSFGLSYRELDDGPRQHVFPSCAPVQFDPGAFHKTLDSLMSYKPGAIYVTHFGQLRDVPRLAADMHRLVDSLAAIGLKHRDAGRDRCKHLEKALAELVLQEARKQNWPLAADKVLELLRADIGLNAIGLEAWLDAGARSSA